MSEGAQAEAAADDGLMGSAGEAEAQDASDFVDGEERTAEEDGVSNEPEHPEEAQPKDDELARQKRRLTARRTAQQEAEARRRTKHQHRLIAGVTIAVVLVTIALLVSWQRWWQFDDAVDLQGQWVTMQEKGAVTVSIDEHVIHLREDVGYTYTIDPVAKTIAYTFGDMEGHGRYWFSTDRDTLVIVDGENYTAISTLFEDIAIWWGNLFSAIQGEEVSGPAGYSAIRLNRAGGNVASAQATTQQTPQSGAASGVGAIVEVPPSDDNASSIDDVGDDTDYSVDSYVFDDFDYDASDDDTPYYEVPVYEEYGNEGFDEGIVEDEGVDGSQDGEL